MIAVYPKDQKELNAIKRWCNEQFGEDRFMDDDGTWTWDMRDGKTFFRFQNETDVFLFALRWA